MRQITILDQRPTTDALAFAVMLLPIPHLPDGMAPASAELVMQTVIGAVEVDPVLGKAAWVVLSPDLKDEIGYAMHEHGAQIHQWYWCQIWWDAQQDDETTRISAALQALREGNRPDPQEPTP